LDKESIQYDFDNDNNNIDEDEDEDEDHVNKEEVKGEGSSLVDKSKIHVSTSKGGSQTKQINQNSSSSTK